MTSTRTPSGTSRSSARAAIASADTSPSRRISWRASSPIDGSPKPYRAASMTAATNRAGSSSAASQLSQADGRCGRAASQSARTMVLPAPAGPTTMGKANLVSPVQPIEQPRPAHEPRHQPGDTELRGREPGSARAGLSRHCRLRHSASASPTQPARLGCQGGSQKSVPGDGTILRKVAGSRPPC